MYECWCVIAHKYHNVVVAYKPILIACIHPNRTSFNFPEAKTSTRKKLTQDKFLFLSYVITYELQHIGIEWFCPTASHRTISSEQPLSRYFDDSKLSSNSIARCAYGNYKHKQSNTLSKLTFMTQLSIRLDSDFLLFGQWFSGTKFKTVFFSIYLRLLSAYKIKPHDLLSSF